MSDQQGSATEPTITPPTAPAAEESVGEVPSAPASEEQPAEMSEPQVKPAPDWWEDA